MYYRKTKKAKLVGYLALLFIGFLLSYNAATSDLEKAKTAEGKSNESIDSQKVDEFIASRSTVSYTLTENEDIKRINWKYGLKLNEDSILHFNPDLDRKSLKEKIPKNTKLQLFIQSKLSKKFLVEE